MNCSVNCDLRRPLAVFFGTLSRPASCSTYIEHSSVNLIRTFVCVEHSSVILSCVFVCGLRIYCLLYQLVL